MVWKTLKCSFSELNLDFTLGGGQSFRWSKNAKNEWRGVLSGNVWTFKQDCDGNILYLIHNTVVDNCKSTAIKKPKLAKNAQKQLCGQKYSAHDHEAILKEYFNLNVTLDDFYSLWSKADENFNQISQNFKGIRILRQDPVENLFSFICSANNNIPRITSMVESLCSQFGERICEVDEQSFNTFPTLGSLSKDGVEEKLRKLGFGYRAKYIYQTAKFIEDNRDLAWLFSLRKLSYEEAHKELVNLPGVGAKVADCICLMSLDKFEAIPVDTHIWQVTVRDYLPHLKNSKTLTPKIYKEIGEFYRRRFGEYAGWANTVLFAADLKKFKDKNKEIKKT